MTYGGYLLTQTRVGTFTLILRSNVIRRFCVISSMKPLRIISCTRKLRAMRPATAGSCALSVLLAAAVLAAPGLAGRALADTAAPAGPVPSPGPALPVPGQADILLISVRESASSPILAWFLTCDPDGGTHPYAVQACDVLSAASDPFAPVPPGVMCSMIYYGPQTATITGYWRGQPVSAQFSRVDGCQEQRWEKIAPVLVLPVGPAPANPGGPYLPGPVVPGSHSPGG